jgi:hypothetical protein
MRRLAYPSFVAACVFVPSVLGLACGAKPPGGPTPVDADNNGIVDGIKGATRIDVNGDGKLDGSDIIDLDGNGIPEGLAVDTDGDGVADAAGKDSTGDGIIDELDTDGDGHVDVKPPPPATGGNASVGGSSSDGSGSGGASSSSGGDSSDDLATSGGSVGAGGGEACQKFELAFTPKIPTVYVLVDRSTSMWSASPPYWDSLRDSVLPVVQDLQDEIRFGFGSFTGKPGACTALTPGAPIAENNYPAIQAAYAALTRPEGDTDTPTPQAVQQVTELLLADPVEGDKFIFLLSDGQPDYCDNPDDVCTTDALVSVLQGSAAQGVKTIVFGVQSSSVKADMFDYFAQAGWGEAPNWPFAFPLAKDQGPQNQCKSYAPWVAARAAAGHAPDPALCVNGVDDEACQQHAGTYSAAGGTKKAFLKPDPAQLGSLIRSNLETLKSCTFDLSDVNVSVDLANANLGKVWLNDEKKLGSPIPQDQWRMVDSKTLELVGAGCQTWLDPATVFIGADFPCEAIILE